MLFQAIFKFIIAFAVIGGYLYLPTLLTESDRTPQSPFELDISAISRLTITSKTGANTRVTKTSEGWQIEDSGAKADDGKIQALLYQLQDANFMRPDDSPEFPRAAPFTLTCRTANGKKQTLHLGPRLKSFTTQLLKFEETNDVWVIDSDLSSLLGLKHTRPASAEYALYPATLYYLEDPVKQLNVEKPFGTYACTRLSEIAVPASERVESEKSKPIHKWDAKANGKTREATSATLHRWAKHLAALPVQKPVSKQRFNATSGRYKLKLNGDGSSGITLTATGSVNNKNRHFVRIEQPEQSVPYAISDFTFARLFPSGDSFIKDVTTISLPIDRTYAVRATRDGKQYILSRKSDKDNWQMVKPKVPYKIYTPAPRPGTPAPAGGARSKAGTFLGRFRSLRTSECVNTRSERCRQLMKAAFAQPRARIEFKYRNKGNRAQKTLTISRKIPGTELRFIRSSNKVITSSKSLTRIVPNIKFFFDPEKVKDIELAW